MVVNGKQPMKRMMKRVSADLYDFLKFPDLDTEFSDHHFRGPFRSNIRSFLSKHGRYPAPCSLFPHLMIWQILLRIGDLVDGDDSSPVVVTLGVIEEDVTKSRSIYCDQCRVVGWSGHPVCGKRYHFIIQRDSGSIDGNLRPCTRCGGLLQVSDYRCKSCDCVTTSDDLENWLHQQIEDTTHLLHGVVHMNGYGHLLRVNGRQGGSKFLSGCDIMNFWDRLCKTLRVRKTSVMDISKKYGLDYRILHAVTNGRPWYGDWGFEFGAGSFALTVDAYKQAVDTLSDMPLSHFFHARNPRTRLQDAINFYQSLSEHNLRTLKDLFIFLMKLIHDAHKSFGVHKKLVSGSLVICPWTSEDIERVEQSIVKVLLAVGNSCWVSWRALKGTLCRMASPELIDHCLRELGGKSVSNGMVISRCNSITNSMEYRLDCCNGISDYVGPAFLSCNRPSESHLLQDLKFLYDSLLNPRTMVNYSSSATSAATKLLDCKQFVKEYKLEQGTSDVCSSVLRFLVNLELADQPKDFTSPPTEFIVLPANATITDLKIEAAKAFQEVYVLFKRLQVDELLGFDRFDDKDQVKLLFGSDATVGARGRCLGIYGMERFRMERGIENWTVSCACGARDDDGERMMACDVCGTWQHTRCAGIDDLDVVPERFICSKCSKSGFTGKKRKNEAGEGGNKSSRKRVGSKSSKICQVQASNCVYQHPKVSSSISEMDCLDTVMDTCSSGKGACYDIERDGTCRDATTAPQKCLEGFEHSVDKETKDENASDLDTSTVTLSDHFEDTFSLLDTCFVEGPNM